MRKVLTTVFATAVALSVAAPASAEPASSSSAAAYGASIGLAGSPLLPPTPAVAASQPPDSGRTLGDNFDSVIPLEVGGLAVTGVVTAAAEAARESRLPATIASLPDTNNARGFASVEGFTLLGSADLLTAIGLPLTTPALLNLRTIEAEAVVECVNNQPVYRRDGRIVGDPPDAQLAGIDLSGLNEVGELLLGTVDQVGATLANLIRVTQNELIDLPNGGKAINALHITVLGVAGGAPLADIVLGHAEAHMPANCGIAPPAPPTGPGPIAPVADLGTLAATGGDFSMTPLVAMAMLGAALGIRRLTVRSRKSVSTPVA